MLFFPGPSSGDYSCPLCIRVGIEIWVREIRVGVRVRLWEDFFVEFRARFLDSVLVTMEKVTEKHKHSPFD